MIKNAAITRVSREIVGNSGQNPQLYYLWIKLNKIEFK